MGVGSGACSPACMRHDCGAHAARASPRDARFHGVQREQYRVHGDTGQATSRKVHCRNMQARGVC